MKDDRQLTAVEVLARESGVSADVVSRIYTAELAKLDDTARIKTFVGVLASRRVRQILGHHQRAAAITAVAFSG